MPRLSRLLHDAVAAEAARLRGSLFHAALSLLLLAIAALVALLGMVFLLVGAYQSLAELVPAWQAGGIIAVAILIIAGLLALVSRWRMSRRRVPPPTDPTISSVAKELRQTAERGVAAGEMLTVRSMKPFDRALAAFIAGLIVSRSVSARPQTQERRSDPGG